MAIIILAILSQHEAAIDWLFLGVIVRRLILDLGNILDLEY